MPDYGLPEPTTGAWVIGAYYRNTQPVHIYRLRNFDDRVPIVIEPGTVWLCNKAKLKWRPTLLGHPLDNPVNNYVELVVRDPRFDDQPQFLTWDVQVWDHLLPRDDETPGFERVTSPLECLAFASGDYAP